MGQNEAEAPDFRSKWIFRYRPAEVLAAAKKKVVHHADRKKWWTEEYAKAEKQLKSKGFEYREHYNSLGRDVQIVGDPELARRAAQCKEKIESHHQRIDSYETWVRALQAKAERQPGEELELKIDDLMFFGL